MPETLQWIDINARNCFYEGAGAGTLKCSIGSNHYGERNSMTNGRTMSNTCPRCHQIESWEHVITCPSVDDLKTEFVTNSKKIKESMQNR